MARQEVTAKRTDGSTGTLTFERSISPIVLEDALGHFYIRSTYLPLSNDYDYYEVSYDLANWSGND